MNIIDIRNRKDYLLGHIDGAESIPYFELFSNYNKYLNKNETYHIYCKSGNTSKRLVEYLNSLGYHTVNIDGGYNKLSSSN